jgi:hypothetical protein
MAISISSRKAKGRNLQKWTCEKISTLSNIPYGYEDNKLIQPRIMGQKGVDVILRGKAKEKFPFSIECKSAQQWNILAAIRQAKKNKIDGTDWLLVLKRKEIKSPVVVIDADVFFKIMEKVNDK